MAQGHRRRTAYLVLTAAGAGVLLALLVLPWHTYAVSVKGAGSFRLERTAVESPGKGLGRVAAVLAAALVLAGASALSRLRPGVDAFLVALSMGLVAVLGAKLVLNTDFLGSGAWVSVVLGVVVSSAGLSLRRTSG